MFSLYFSYFWLFLLLNVMLLLQDILPPDVFDALSPDHIAPVVGWLSHEDCQEKYLK